MSNIIGLDKVLRNLNSSIRQIENKSLKGLIRAGILVIRDMEKVTPKIPVDTGNLRNSRFLVTSTGDSKISEGTFMGENAGDLAQGHREVQNQQIAEIQKRKAPYISFGFTANYSWFVHEMVDATFQRPGAGAKFLQASLARNKEKMISVIKEEMKI